MLRLVMPMIRTLDSSLSSTALYSSSNRRLMLRSCIHHPFGHQHLAPRNVHIFQECKLASRRGPFSHFIASARRQSTVEVLQEITQGQSPDLKSDGDISGPPVPRSYQLEAIEESLDGWNNRGHKRQLIAMATGAGKTVMFCQLVKQLDMKTLILVNRKELVHQTVKTLKDVCGEDVDLGIVHAKQKQAHRNVVVATIQSASQPKTVQMLSEQDFQLLIIDEAHHSSANTYVTVMLNCGFISQEDAVAISTANSGPPGAGRLASRSPSVEPSSDRDDDSPSLEQLVTSQSSGKLFITNTLNSTKLVLGVTATPYRNDTREALRCVFERLAYEVQLPELIREGYLCKVRAYRVNTHADISNVGLKAPKAGDDDGTADFSPAELSKAVNTPSRNNLIVDTYIKQGQNRKAIAFCCDIAHAEDLAEAFREQGVSAESLTSAQSKDDRDALLQQHRRGEIKVLTNVQILTEGYDDRSVSCVLMARPTKSTGLYTQSVGRGLRICPEEGKEDCLIFDFTDRSHRLDKATDLINSEFMFQQAEGVELIGYQPPAPHERVAPEIKALLQGGEMTLFGDSQFAWVELANDLWLRVQDWQFTKKGLPPRQPMVWIHLMCNGHVTIRRKHQLSYTLRMAKGKFMPAIDSSEWVTLADDLLTPLPDAVTPTVQSRSKSTSRNKSSTGRQKQASADVLDQLVTSSMDSDSEDEDANVDDNDDDKPALLSSRMLSQVERMVKKAAKDRVCGLHPAVLELVKAETKWGAHPATDGQYKIIASSNDKWGLFENESQIPKNMTKRMATRAISLGIIFEAYQKANPTINSPPASLASLWQKDRD